MTSITAKITTKFCSPTKTSKYSSCAPGAKYAIYSCFVLSSHFERHLRTCSVVHAVGVPFPRNYITSVKKIMTRLFRVFVHVYIHHFDKLVGIGAVRFAFVFWLQLMLLSRVPQSCTMLSFACVEFLATALSVRCLKFKNASCVCQECSDKLLFLHIFLI